MDGTIFDVLSSAEKANPCVCVRLIGIIFFFLSYKAETAYICIF